MILFLHNEPARNIIETTESGLPEPPDKANKTIRGATEPFAIKKSYPKRGSFFLFPGIEVEYKNQSSFQKTSEFLPL